METAQASLLPDGKRLHLHHGPIDLVIEVTGSGRLDAYRRATSRFENLLEELVEELPKLRSQGNSGSVFSGAVAKRMQRAILPFCGVSFVTPMAAVAGSVADEILNYICRGKGVDKAYVNNGGDIAFHLLEGEKITAMPAASAGTTLTIGHRDIWRGVATSGWRGRSHSLGIADAVNVIAKDAASADVAATMIANAVSIGPCFEVEQRPAAELSPDSDLGMTPVTTHVGRLSEEQARQALDNGADLAQQFLDQQLIGGACLQLGELVRVVGHLPIQVPEKNSFNKRELLHA